MLLLLLYNGLELSKYIRIIYVCKIHPYHILSPSLLSLFTHSNNYRPSEAKLCKTSLNKVLKIIILKRKENHGLLRGSC